MTVSRFRVAAAGLILAPAVTLAAISWSGFFYQDDFLFLSMAHDSPLSWHYLGEGAFGHFFPGFRAAFLVLDRTVGLNHDVATIAVAVVHVATLVAMCRLLVLLFGRTRGTLALLALFGFSTLWLSGYLWWVSALQVMPAMFFTVIAIDAHVRYLAGRRMRHVVIAAGALGLSLVFYEKPVQLVLLLPLLTVLLFSSRDSVRGWLSALGGAWRMWAAFAAVLAFYAVFYVTGDYFVSAPRPGPGTIAHTFALAWDQSFVPSFLGGPLDFRWNGSLGAPDPPRWLAVADQLVAFTVVGVSVARRPIAWRGWVFLITAFAVNVAIIAWTRAGIFGADVGRELKYLIDILPYAIVGIGIALVPLRVGPRAAPAAASERTRTAWPVYGLGVGAVAFVAIYAISVSRMGQQWHDGENARFARTFKAEIKRVHPERAGTILFDGDVTPGILSGAFQPYQRQSVLLRLFDEHLRFAGPATRTLAVTDQGRIIPHLILNQGALRLDALTVDGEPARKRSGGAVCLPAATQTRKLVVPLSAPLQPGHPYVRLNATSPAGASLSFPQQEGVGDGATLPAKRLNSFTVDSSGTPLYVPLEAEGATAVQIVVAPGGAVCLREGVTGNRQPTGR